MKNVLITGASGFIGKNLSTTLFYNKEIKVFEFNKNDSLSQLSSMVKEADFIFHLAGINRPLNNEEFQVGNVNLTRSLVELLHEHKKKIPLLISSSTQVNLENPYGKSKYEAEQAVFSYAQVSGATVYVYRLPNVFGKWSRPNYNSAIATFCHNISHNLEIQVNDPKVILNLVYIDDVVNEFISLLKESRIRSNELCTVEPVYKIELGEIVKLINSFKKSREERSIPDMSDPFTKKLYSTYLSFLPTDQFSYPLKMHEDVRGSFTEFFKTIDRGQVSINISKPKIAKGNHWHHTKNEKFLVVSGLGSIQFRKVGSEEIIEYRVSGEKLEVVDIPTGYTHCISNLGNSDLVTVMWANESFNPERADTNILPVLVVKD